MKIKKKSRSIQLTGCKGPVRSEESQLEPFRGQSNGFSEAQILSCFSSPKEEPSPKFVKPSTIVRKEPAFRFQPPLLGVCQPSMSVDAFSDNPRRRPAKDFPSLDEMDRVKNR